VSDLPPNLEQLDAELLALGEGAMLLDELDGFVAGLLVCREIILPSEWMPMVVNRFGADQAGFDDVDHANRVLGLVRQHYNSVAILLIEDPGEFRPLLSFDSHEDRIVWELWIDGFESAVGLRPGSWKKFLDADAATATAIRGMFALADAACSDQVLPEADYAALDATAAGDIARWVITLKAWRLANDRQGQGIESRGRPAGSKKIGRNDPCPCGSGKKYKRCCGLD
jgi:uncharacterized protein